MTPQELDWRVRQYVRAVQSGHRVEDDAVELKGAWPDPREKARQLAASANRLAGEDLIYVIGVDEETGLVVPPGNPMEAGEWIAQAQKRFNQGTYPDMYMHQTVFVSEDASVTVLVFKTEHFPYVVTRTDGDREVPIRSGAHTRSAHRHEPVDLLTERVPVPQISVVEANLTASWVETTNSYKSPDNEDASSIEVSLSLRVDLTVFIAHIGRSSVALPTHGMFGRILLDASEFRFANARRARQTESRSSFFPIVRERSDDPPVARNIQLQGGHLVVNGPGEFEMYGVHYLVEKLPSGRLSRIHEILERAAEVTFETVFSVVGSRRTRRHTFTLGREGPLGSTDVKKTSENIQSHVIGRWGFQDEVLDPWEKDA